MFKIGEKVVCIDASNQVRGGLVLNEIYEVTGLMPNSKGVIIGVYVIGFNYCHKEHRFRKMDHDFADNLLAQIKEEVMCNI